MKNLIVTLVITLTTITNFGQSVTDDTNKNANSESTQSKAEFVRPEKMRSLRKFVETHFVNRVDKETILETIADGKPAITFSFTDGDRTTASILIDNGDFLELHNDSYPTVWKRAESNQYPDYSDGLPFMDDSTNKDDESSTSAAASVPTCAGVASPGNPYPCCLTNKGNCTFYAWHAAKTFWNYSMPTWGGNGASNAGKWYDNARNISGLPTSQRMFINQPDQE